ncbi:sodium:alanine symporter family protein [Candidatus Sumerlaeota bacterium]|nr:sodium:alanine symporter family protein [Candidatus Sumerlaeota bacterium]
MEQLQNWVNAVNGFVWGPAMITLLVGTGIYLTLRLRFLQLRYFGHAVRCISGKYDNPDEQGDISHFQALCAALSATIGTGNIAGVATAISLGGPGAVFWMWVTALIGMATKFTSCSLALKYRELHPDGSASGGPMYFLSRGVKPSPLGKFLGVCFALFAGLASFGIGCAVQSNSVIDGLRHAFGGPAWEATLPEGVPMLGNVAYMNLALGIALAFLVGLVIIGGIRRIARVAEKIVPFMCVVYVFGALIILFRYYYALPAAFGQIFQYAFTPFSIGGGFAGVVVQQTVRFGVARGVFSNESGLGSAPIAHAAAKTQEMAREGFVAMLGPFIDTIIVCSMTALVIISTGAWEVRSESDELIYGPGARNAVEPVSGVMIYPADGGEAYLAEASIRSVRHSIADAGGQTDAYYEIPTGAALTGMAFEKGLPRFGRFIVAFGLVFFAYSTMISWSYYGDRCWEYLLGPKAVAPYRYLFCVFVVIGATISLKLVWDIADTLNAMMAIPNLIGLLVLSGVVASATKDYLKRMKESGDV